MAYRITEDCLACGACVDACPWDAISEGDDIYVIDPVKCDDCGFCVDSCPNDAIVAGGLPQAHGRYLSEGGDMPGRDGTGPLGQGPMTGGARGPCRRPALRRTDIEETRLGPGVGGTQTGGQDGQGVRRRQRHRRREGGGHADSSALQS
ncbi:MAG: 4Fe-4S binding protein [Actinobacteria bacterium]|nr:4Fe-4S binding protein [Actinomycetota bacterium]